MKYIIIEQKAAIIFNDVITHADMAAKFSHLGEPTSAGFLEVYLNPDSVDGILVSTYGESVSLKLKPSIYDPELIKSQLSS